MYWRSSGPKVSRMLRMCPITGKLRMIARRFCTTSWRARSTTKPPIPTRIQSPTDMGDDPIPGAARGVYSPQRRNMTGLSVSEGHVVTFHYTLRDDDGDILDSSAGGEPMDYLHGHGGIVPGLERELTGKSAGDKFKVTVAPKDAYGEVGGAGPRAVPRDAF